jgi:GTP 3',8-cyclase
VRHRVEKVGPLEPTSGPCGHGPARYYRLPGAQGSVGFISPMSEHFCATCNRLRLTADGWLRACLFVDEGVHIKPALDAGADLTTLQALIRQVVGSKLEHRPFSGDVGVTGKAMSMIGG